ncbi:MAG TPA: fibronectin type III domain-containing protein [Thermoanaerobaculia bacterium]|nr:fibronectin type III domain-containing protein [Thermoanaerobaculia bacterium]
MRFRDHALLLSLLLLAPALAAQPLFFGDAAPQTDTRYGTAGALPQLATNGQTFFLFWATDSKLRVTRLVEGQNRAGRPILSGNIVRFDVVWTGTHFLVAGDELDAQGDHQIRGRLLNGNGEPVGGPFPIATGSSPSLAFDGVRVLLTYGSGERQFLLLLRPDGVRTTEPSALTPPFPPIVDSAAASGGRGFVSAVAYVDLVRIETLFPFTGSWDIGKATPVLHRRVAAGSNGQDALVVWTNGSAAAEWVLVDGNGHFSAPASIAGTEGAADVAVSWNGAKWAVSTIAGGKLHTRLLDGATGASVEAHAPVKAHDASPVSLASLNGRTFVAWRGTGAAQPVLLRDLAASGNGNEAAFAAAEQALQTAAWSHEAALLVWSELRDGKRTLHAGVRAAGGGWIENRIGTAEDSPLAASDGLNFLVIKKSDEGWSAITLNDQAEILASSPIIKTFTPTDIAWDGTSWVVIGLGGNTQIFVARVMPWGAVSAPVLIEQREGTRQLENPRIVAGGGGFLAVWQNSDFTMCFPVCEPYDSVLHGVRLTPGLQRDHPLNLAIAEDEAVSPDLFWDGSRFQIFWLDGGALETRSLRPDSGGSGTTRIDGVQIGTGTLRATLTPVGTTITADDGEVLLLRNNELVQRYTLGNPSSPDALVNLGPDVAYVQAQPRDVMPYHGASHLFLSTGGVIPRDTMPLPPEIVRASMTDGGKAMVLEWAPPLDPVHGYRVEYRVDDGAWNELSEWFPATTTSASIQPWLDHVKYQFRMRAWSDAGVSEYSLPATVRLLGRRRAVR